MSPRHAQPEPAHGPMLTDKVCVSARRKGITAHRPAGELTGCDLPMGAAEQLSAIDARAEYHVTWCTTCWPGGDGA